VSPSPSATLSATVEATPSATAGATGSLDVTSTLVTGLDTPWGLTFLPDRTALLGSRDSAEMRLLTPAGGHVTTSLVATMPGVVHDGEGGLLTIVTSPTFARDRQLFVYHSTASDNRVTRITYADGKLSSPTEILTGLPRNAHHNGGGLAFGPDGLLYVGTGDGEDKSLPQNRASLGGKILRITPTGGAAPGNPFGTKVLSYGHRNVEAIAFDGRQLWAVEFGDKTADELNRIVAGANYGWPQTQGRTTDAGITSPAVQWPTDDAGPAGIAIRNGVAWIACLTGKCVYRVRLNPTGADEPQRFLDDTDGRLRRIVPAPDGSLWLISNNTDGRATPRPGDDRILRLRVT
jgi:glucose/arabinose dehydrogenase